MNLKQLPPERFGRIGAFCYRIAAERGLAPYYEAVARAAASRLPGLPRVPVAILDLGCGPGALTRRLAAAAGGARVAGVDEALTMLDQSRKARRPAGATDAAGAPPLLVAASVAALPLAGGTVSLALASLAFHHWEEPEAALAEVHRVLVPGGEMWTLEPDPGFQGPALDAGMRRLLGIWPPRWMLRRAFAQHGLAGHEYADLVAPLVARSPFGAIASVEPFLWLRRMVLRRLARAQEAATRTPGTRSDGTAT